MGYAVKSIAYEAVQYQQALEKIARYGVPEREAKVHGEDIPVLMRPCPIIGLPRHPDVSQDERIMSMDGPISRLEVKILKSCPIAQRLHDQLRQFPNGPRDGIDAMQGLWEKTSVPAKPLTAEGPSLPLHVLALMDRVKRQPLDRPQLCGTNRSVALTSWN
jgi:hypothetical protein